eukprot:CAMPEP_0180178832 /NCGR_PEP_ID=MMETSP0986-20121125/38675_1 /TAXON_ID=697907 /ORGANISM="non described non described, Strain CCMP2293" /LENGTH=44 /DNA_ID= /DNA_START= /DNA_END= /DNA_ORIENTATION=
MGVSALSAPPRAFTAAGAVRAAAEERGAAASEWAGADARTRRSP